MMGTVVIIDPDEGFRGSLLKALKHAGQKRIDTAEDLATGCEVVDTVDPYVVVIGPAVPVDEALREASRVCEARSGTAAVLVSSEPTPDTLRAALRAGLRDVVPADQPAEDIAVAVMDAYAHAERVRAAAPPPAPAGDSEVRGKVITVFSTKGGVGKTVIATNLGCALAKQEGKKVILLDLDLQFGDTGIMLQLTPDRTIADVVQSFDRLDRDMLSGFLSEHSSGLYVLLAPIHPEDAEGITASRVAGIVDMLRTMADYVVVDTPAEFNEVVLTAIDHSDEVYAIATMDVAAIKNMRISLQKLKQLGYDDKAVRLVLNRADSKVWLTSADVERAVESDILVKIPSDLLVPRSVNKGVPVVLDAPKSPVAKSLVELANEVAKNGGKVVRDVA